MPRLLDRRNLKRFAMLLLGIYWLAMFAGTHWPKTPQFVQGNSDKLIHFLGYAGLAALCSFALAGSVPATLTTPAEAAGSIAT